MDPATNLILSALAAASSQLLSHSTELNFRNGLNRTAAVSSRYSTCFPGERTVYGEAVENLDGTRFDLADYRGRVILIVNTATYDDFTPQYRDFNELLDAYGPELVVIAFPSDQFHHSEPGSNEEIINGLRFVRPGGDWLPHVDLKIVSKVDVNGAGQHPIYSFLQEQCPQTVKELAKKEQLGYDSVKITDVTWNFEKFLIDRRGRPRYRFHPTAWLGGKASLAEFNSVNSPRWCVLSSSGSSPNPEHHVP